MAEGSAGTLFVDIRANIATLEKDLGRMSNALNRQAKTFLNIGSSLSKVITLPLAAAAAASIKAANDIGGAQKIIASRTSATGDALRGLNEVFRQVAKEAAVSFDAAATATASLYTSTGQTGEGLTELATTVSELSKLTGEDLNTTVSAAGKLFNAWNVETANQTETLNVFYRASRETGASVEEMLATISGSDEVFGSLGFSLNESVALMGAFHKAGIDGEGAVSSLNKAIGFLSKKGVKDLEGGFRGIVEAIKNAKTDSEAYRIALEVFGKSGISVANAIREGRFEIDKLTQTISTGGDTIREQAKATKTFSDALQTLKNNFIDAFEPIGRLLLDQEKSLSAAFQNIAKDVAAAVKWFSSLSASTQENIIKLFALAAAMGPVSTYFGLVLQSGSAMLKVFKDLAGLVKGSEIALGGLNLVLKPISALFGALETPLLRLRVAFLDFFSIGFADFFGAFKFGLGGIGIAFGLLAGVILLQGGKMSTLLRAVADIVKGLFVAAFDLASSAVQGIWSTLVSWFDGACEALKNAFIGFLVVMGASPEQIRGICNAITSVWNEFVASFTRGLQVLTERWEGFWSNFRRGILVIGTKIGSQATIDLAYQMEDAAQKAKKLADEMQKLAANGKGAEVFMGDIGTLTGQAASQMESWGKKAKKAAPDITGLLDDAKKKAKEAQDAIEAMQKSLASEKAEAAIEKLKDQIDRLVSGVGGTKGLGSDVDLSGLYAQYKAQLVDKLMAEWKDKLDAMPASALPAAYAAIDQEAAYRLEVYQNEVAKKQLEIDQQNHEKSVGFFKGLLEDAISESRFDWVEQFKKAAVEIGAEFLANIVKANILGSKSFMDLFGKVVNALGSAFSSWFGNSGIGSVIGSGGSGAGGIFGSILGTGAAAAAGSGALGAGTVVAGSGEAAAGMAQLTTGANAAGTSLAGIASIAIPAAAVIGGAYALYSSGKNIAGWNSNTTSETKAFDMITAALNVVAPGIGLIVDKTLGRFFSGNALTKNQQALKSFEKYVEETLKKSFGKAMNFVLGDIDKFDSGNWADQFWSDFGERGAGTFDALGKVFEEMLGLEEGIGGQIGALLAENLAGDTLNESLDNIKLFLDGMGLSVEDMKKALLDVAKAGEITWQEFDIMNNKLNQIPETGLAGLGDIAGAFDQIVTSGGRGIQAIQGIRNIAVEAGELGVKSFEELRQKLLAAGYDAKTVDAFFQALSQRGITSFEQFANATDEQLGGVIADMTTLGVEWDKFSPKEGLDESTEGFQNLADKIKNVNKELEKLPGRVHIQTSISGDGVTENAKGNVYGFAAGEIFNKATLFKHAGGLGVLGEAGPEAIMPLTRINGRLGVMAKGMGGSPVGLTINVDARGGEAGLEHKLMSVMSAWGQEMRRDLMDTIAYQSRRGVY